MIVDYKLYALFNYVSNTGAGDTFTLGQVVINTRNDIGVVIQVHSKHEMRTDMYGNCCDTNSRAASIEEIKKHRLDLIVVAKKESLQNAANSIGGVVHIIEYMDNRKASKYCMTIDGTNIGPTLDYDNMNHFLLGYNAAKKHIA
jgi:hypothetical protein